MNREFYCVTCGLFFWDELSNFRYNYKCPHCEAMNNEVGQFVWAVDSTAFAYFAETYAETIKAKNWSSPQYAPEYAIGIYRKQGVLIKE